MYQGADKETYALSNCSIHFEEIQFQNESYMWQDTYLTQ